jgi:hypothetical protein
VLRQCFALGAAALLVLGCASAWGAVRGAALQGSELRLQARVVGGEGLFEDLALLGVHGFGLGTEPPGLELGELERDALDLGVTPLDALGLRVELLGLRVDVLGLLPDVGQHLRRQLGQLSGAERLEISVFDRMQIEHAALCKPRNPSSLGLLLIDLAGAF